MIYPVLDARMETKSMRLFTDTPMCNTRAMEKYFDLYLSREVRELLSHDHSFDYEISREYLSPTETNTLGGLPPVFIEVAQYDCLRDEGLQYAEKLKKAGVRTEVCKVRGAMHGYDIATGTHLVKNCIKRRIAFLRTIFENCGKIDSEEKQINEGTKIDRKD